MTAIDNEALVERKVEPKEKHSLWARVLSEFAGSFLICFCIYLMCTFGSTLYSVNLAFIALGTGVVYAAMTMIFGKISGGQFNPAITLAAMLTSKTRVADGVLYIVAQIIGAICAGGLVKAILPTSQSISASQWFAMSVNGFDKGSSLYASLNQLGLTFNVTIAIVVELIASIIVVAAAMVTLKNNGKPTHTHALSMGLAYAAAVAMAYPVTGASVNPIRATGIAIFAQGEGLAQEPLAQLWVFWVCAILGAAIVALVIIVAQLIAGRNTEDMMAQEVAEDAQEEALEEKASEVLAEHDDDESSVTTDEDVALTGAQANALEAQQADTEIK
ncbi:MIP/aquaporin family protein [Bifidobacterium magnum]|uniref:Major intrinsic protein n=1 Tax=Bifidobacterium magnum TaxID=1692 RepID=A0A087BA42_9BIFI|nr:aquaporin [Bifidobacterium magnum]KFI67892.1 Major intrinsic protein [Bifidobacterium magnum]